MPAVAASRRRSVPIWRDAKLGYVVSSH